MGEEVGWTMGNNVWLAIVQIIVTGPKRILEVQVFWKRSFQSGVGCVVMLQVKRPSCARKCRTILSFFGVYHDLNLQALLLHQWAYRPTVLQVLVCGQIILGWWLESPKPLEEKIRTERECLDNSWERIFCAWMKIDENKSSNVGKSLGNM